MKLLLILFTLVVVAQAETASSIVLKDLRCEGALNPTAVRTATPSLSWRLEGTARGLFQKSLQILASSSPEKLAAGEGDLWDSGEVASNRSQSFPYQGKALEDKQTVYWKVRIKDHEGKLSAWSPPAQFTIDLKAPIDKSITLYLKNAPRISSFEASDSALNNLFAGAANTLPAINSLRDIQLTLRGAGYHQKLFPRATEWLSKLNQAMDEEGRYPATLPSDRSFGSTQSDAGILTTHALYTSSGDIALLKDSWDNLNKYIHARKKHDPAFAGRPFGKLPEDTLPKGDPFPEPAVHLASHGLSLRIMKELARAAASTPFEEPMLQSAINNLQTSFKDLHLKKNGELKYDSLPGQLITLRYGLLAQEKDKQAVIKQFKKLVATKEDSVLFSQGPLASAALLPVLTWTDQLDRAVAITKEQKAENLSPVALVNLSEWLIWMVAGIDNGGAGYQNLRFTPYIPKKETLSFAKAHLDTDYGRVSSHWHYNDKGLAYDVALPPNTQGMVKIPATDKQAITEDGKELKEGNGILKIVRHPKYAEIYVLSGPYQFQVAN